MSVAWSSHPRVAWRVADGFWLGFILSAISLLCAWCQLPEAPTFGWRDESLMASDLGSFYNICMHDVSCLKLPPSGGVMSRWWLLNLTSRVHFVCSHNRIWYWDTSTFFSTACLTSIFEPSVLGYVLYIQDSKIILCSKSYPFRKFYHICMHDVSCLKLPPLGGVTSRWWLLILTSEFTFVCCHYVW